MERLYKSIVNQHFDESGQMLFLAGPRQVGKTTVAKYWLAEHHQHRPIIVPARTLLSQLL